MIFSHKLRRAAGVALLSLAPLLLPVQSGAVALGEVAMHSALGQKLDADIEISALSAVEAQSLAVRLAPAEAFAESGIEYTPVLRSLRLSIEKKNDRQVIHLGSELPVSDPFLILLIEINANGNRTTRQYALLLDPPAVNDEPRVTTIEPPAAASPAIVAGGAGLVSDRAPTPGQSTRPATPAAPAARADSDARSVNVRRGDTLAQIAQRLPPQAGSLDQVLIAFLSANPQAFADRNIHRIKAGSVLRVPDEATIKSVSADDAHRQVLLQTQDFHRYRGLVAATARGAEAATPTATPTASDPATRSSSGKVGVQQRSAGSAPEASDQLRLSAPPATADNRAGKKAAADGALDQIASAKALDDAKSRIAELEKNIGDIQQQLAVKNSSLAAAQKNAEPAPSATAVPAPPQGQGPLREDAPANSSARPNPKPAFTTAKPATVRAEEPDVVSHLTSTLQSMMDDLRSPPGALSAFGILAAGGLLLLIRSRLRRRSVPAERVEPNAGAQSVFGQAGGRHVDTSNSVFHSNFVPSVSQLDANEVDAIAEADVYIAYGRDEQAEEILLDALKQHPARHALRVKLLEIHSARKDLQKFGTLASELRVLTHGEGPEWAQAAQMGRQLDPDNQLYGEAATSLPAVKSAEPKQPAVRASAVNASSVSASAASAVHAPSLPAAPDTAPLGLLRPDAAMTFPPVAPSVSSSVPSSVPPSSVDDFEIKLEGLLDERRKDQGDAGLTLVPQPQKPAPVSPVTDFRLTGIQTEPAPTEREFIALKTKIDLAMACQEIGDKDGARELLTEVAGTRHAELANRAQSLLQQLA